MVNDFGPRQRRHDKFNTAQTRAPESPSAGGSSNSQQPSVISSHAGQPSANPPTDFGESPTLDTSNLNTKPPKKKGFPWINLTKKQWWIVGGVALALLIAGLGWWAWKANQPSKSVIETTKGSKKEPPPPTTVASTLTGLQVDPSLNERPVTGVMIENSPDARPQSSLDQAGVVFEAVAEGGITRFLAIFQDTAPDYIGPIRSVRPYYVDWIHGFDGAISHVGGSPAALAKIKAEGVKDLDQFANGSYYTRISSRYAPHNVYTSMANLNALEAKKGYGAARFTGFVRKPDEISKQPTARAIDFNISGATYNAHFDYDPATNVYMRSQAGAVHLQVNTGGAQAQIRPRVVVALVMAKGIEADDLHTSYATIGSGPMYVFQDGIVQQGTWSKTGGATQFVFTDAAGKPLKLNVGQTWITVLGAATAITYRP